MSLTKRETAKVNAALLEIHHAGIDTGEVTNVAKALLNTGPPPRQAYETAFNKFAANRPDFRASLMRIGQLIEATDLPTLARYNVAMARYIETGDYDEFAKIAPEVQQDLSAMAERTGDAGFADMAGAFAVSEAPIAPEQPTAPEKGPGHTHMGFQPSAVPQQDSQGK